VLVVVGLAILEGLVAPATAVAHPAIDEAEALLAEAEFSEALERLREAEAGADLSREDLIALLELRAVLELALAPDVVPTQTLLGLASLAPERSLSPSRAPEIRRALAEAQAGLRGPLEVTVVVTREADRVRLAAEVEGDPAALVRSVRIGVKVLGVDADGTSTAEWSEGMRTEATVGVGDGEAVHYYAEAVGPGDAVVARDGTRDAPRVLVNRASTQTPGTTDGHVAPEPGGASPVRSDESGAGGLVWALGIGGVVVAAVAVTLVIVLVATGNDDSVVGPPLFEF
jgi:hypothetical protein